MNPTKRLPASTLVEVLILMILGGTVFLSVMDGFGLLRRFLDRTSLQIAGRTEQYAGYFRTADLAGMSDSLLAEDNGALALYRGGEIYGRIERIDSALIVHQGERTDTLLRKVAGLRTIPEIPRDRPVDTLVVELRTAQDSLRCIGFAPRHRSDPLLRKLSEAEGKYRYDESN